MDSLFLIISLLAVLFLVLGLIKPKLAFQPSRKRVAIIYPIAIVVSFILFGITTDTPPRSEVASSEVVEESNSQKNNEDSLPEEASDSDSSEEADKNDNPITEGNKNNKEQQGDIEHDYVFYLEYDVPGLTEGQLELPEEAAGYIKDNAIYFSPDGNLEEIKDIAEYVDFKELDKNVKPHLNKMLSISGSVISIEEDEIEGVPYTMIHLLDDDFNSYTAIMYKHAEGIYSDDVVNLYGTPIGKYAFSNVSGGFTNAILIVGAEVEKE